MKCFWLLCFLLIVNSCSQKTREQYELSGLEKMTFYPENYKGAIEDFDIAIELDSSQAGTYDNRASAKEFLGDLLGALNDYNKAIQIAPTNSEFYTHRGLLYRKMKDFDNAMKDFDKAIEIDTTFFRAYEGRADLWYATDSFVKAIAQYSKAISVNENYDATPYLWRGLSQCKIGDHKKAIADFSEAIRIKPKDSYLYNKRAECYVHLIEGECKLNCAI